MKKIKIYLAGKMSGLSYEEMNKWRVEVSNELKKIEYNLDNCYPIKEYNILCQNPCDYYNFELDPNTYTEHEIKEFDLYLVKNCDLILVNLDYPDSIGTAIELELASRIWNKPIIGFGNTKNHPWIELTLNKRCGTLQDAVKHIKDFYLVNI